MGIEEHIWATNAYAKDYSDTALVKQICEHLNSQGVAIANLTENKKTRGRSVSNKKTANCKTIDTNATLFDENVQAVWHSHSR